MNDLHVAYVLGIIIGLAAAGVIALFWALLND